MSFVSPVLPSPTSSVTDADNRMASVMGAASFVSPKHKPVRQLPATTGARSRARSRVTSGENVDGSNSRSRGKSITAKSRVMDWCKPGYQKQTHSHRNCGCHQSFSFKPQICPHSEKIVRHSRLRRESSTPALSSASKNKKTNLPHYNTLPDLFGTATVTRDSDDQNASFNSDDLDSPPLPKALAFDQPLDANGVAQDFSPTNSNTPTAQIFAADEDQHVFTTAQSSNASSTPQNVSVVAVDGDETGMASFIVDSTEDDDLVNATGPTGVASSSSFDVTHVAAIGADDESMTSTIVEQEMDQTSQPIKTSADDDADQDNDQTSQPFQSSADGVDGINRRSSLGAYYHSMRHAVSAYLFNRTQTKQDTEDDHAALEEHQEREQEVEKPEQAALPVHIGQEEQHEKQQQAEQEELEESQQAQDQQEVKEERPHDETSEFKQAQEVEHRETQHSQLETPVEDQALAVDESLAEASSAEKGQLEEQVPPFNAVADLKSDTQPAPIEPQKFKTSVGKARFVRARSVSGSSSSAVPSTIKMVTTTGLKNRPGLNPVVMDTVSVLDESQEFSPVTSVVGTHHRKALSCVSTVTATDQSELDISTQSMAPTIMESIEDEDLSASFSSFTSAHRSMPSVGFGRQASMMSMVAVQEESSDDEDSNMVASMLDTEEHKQQEQQLELQGQCDEQEKGHGQETEVPAAQKRELSQASFHPDMLEVDTDDAGVDPFKLNTSQGSAEYQQASRMRVIGVDDLALDESAGMNVSVVSAVAQLASFDGFDDGAELEIVPEDEVSQAKRAITTMVDAEAFEASVCEDADADTEELSASAAVMQDTSCSTGVGTEDELQVSDDTQSAPRVKSRAEIICIAVLLFVCLVLAVLLLDEKMRVCSYDWEGNPTSSWFHNELACTNWRPAT